MRQVATRLGIRSSFRKESGMITAVFGWWTRPQTEAVFNRSRDSAGGRFRCKVLLVEQLKHKSVVEGEGSFAAS